MPSLRRDSKTTHANSTMKRRIPEDASEDPAEFNQKRIEPNKMNGRKTTRRALSRWFQAEITIVAARDNVECWARKMDVNQQNIEREQLDPGDARKWGLANWEDVIIKLRSWDYTENSALRIRGGSAENFVTVEKRDFAVGNYYGWEAGENAERRNEIHARRRDNYDK